MRRCREAAEMTLIAEEFGRKISDVNGVYIGSVEPGRLEPRGDDFLHAVSQLAALARPITREIGLPSTEEIYAFTHADPIRQVRVRLNQ